MKRPLLLATLIAAVAPIAPHAAVPIEDGLVWFPRVPGPGDQRYLVHENFCGDRVGVVNDATMTLVDADTGRWRLDYQADGLGCGTPPPFTSLMAIPVPDAIDGVPVTLVDIVRTHQTNDTLDAQWTTRVPERVGVPTSIVGTWYHDAHFEQGFLITLTQRGEAAVSWNTYGADGRQTWLSGVGATEPGVSEFSVDLVDTGTGAFVGTPVAPEALTDWGTIDLEYLGCGELAAAWTSAAATGLPPGSARLRQLTAPYGDACDLQGWAESQGSEVVLVEVDAVP